MTIKNIYAHFVYPFYIQQHTCVYVCVNVRVCLCLCFNNWNLKLAMKHIFITTTSC